MARTKKRSAPKRRTAQEIAVKMKKKRERKERWLAAKARQEKDTTDDGEKQEAVVADQN